MNFIRSDIYVNIWLKNIENYYNYSNYKISSKGIISNPVVNSEFLYIRRLFIDWIISTKNFSNMKRFQSFKFSLKKYLKSLPQDGLSDKIIIWKDLQIFLKNHGQFLKDIYYDLKKSNKHLSKKLVLLHFSTICVNFFYKWRQKRNDSKRSWFGYDNRRKKPSNINMAFFSNIMLKEAEYTRFRGFLYDDSDYVSIYQ